MSLATNKRRIRVDERIRNILVNGRMPSVDEISSAIQNSIVKGEGSTSEPTRYVPGNTLSADHFNAFADAIDQDIETMRMSIDDGWSRLEALLLSSDLFAALDHRAAALSKTARKMLSTMAEADSFCFGTTVDLSSTNGIDGSLSRGQSVDTVAGTVSISKVGSTNIPDSSVLITSVDMSSSAGSPNVTYFGTPDMMVDPSSGRRFIAECYSNDADIYHEMVISCKIAENAQNSRMVSSVVLDSSSISGQSVVVHTTYDGKNWELLGTGSGNHRICITGTRRHVTNIRIKIGKTKADGRRLVENQFKAIYAFDIDHLSISEASYANGADVVTSSIPLTTDGVATVIVGGDLQVPDGTQVRLFVADDIDGASSVDDFSWKEVHLGDRAEVGNVKLDVVKFVVNTAAKIITGSGAVSDVWELGDTAGELTSVYAGVDQVKIVSVVAADPAAAELTLTGPTDGAVGYRDAGNQITLSGSNLYRIEMGIWSTYSDSVTIDLGLADMIAGTDYRVSVNGQEITSSHDGSKIAFGITSGKNTFSISIKRNSVNPFTVTVGKPSVHKIAVSKPAVVSESNLSSVTQAVSFDDGSIKSNFDPRGMNFEIVEKTVTPAFTAGAIRLRAVLSSETGSCTPTIRSWYVISGG